MKKYIIIAIFLFSIALLLTSCNKNEKFNFDEIFKLEAQVLTETDSMVFENLAKKIDYVCNKYQEKWALIQIKPSEYSFYYEIKTDDDTGDKLLSGFAVSECVVENVLALNNGAAIKEGKTVNIKQRIFLSTDDDTLLNKFYENNGAKIIKDESGKIISFEIKDGIYEVSPDDIDISKFYLMMSVDDLPLSSTMTYYSVVIDSGAYYDIINISTVCEKDISSVSIYNKYEKSNEMIKLSKEVYDMAEKLIQNKK